MLNNLKIAVDLVIRNKFTKLIILVIALILVSGVVISVYQKGADSLVENYNSTDYYYERMITVGVKEGYTTEERYEVDNDTYSSVIYTDIDYFNSIVLEYDLLDDCFNYHLILNSYQDVDDVIENLEEQGYTAYLSDSSGLNEFKIYKSLNKFISYFIIILTIFIVISYLVTISMIINKEKETIALLKTNGYLLIHIFIILLLSVLSLVLLSFLISVAICIVITSVLSICKISIYTSYHFSFILIVKVLFGLITLLVLSLVLFFQKIKKITIVDLLNE